MKNKFIAIIAGMLVFSIASAFAEPRPSRSSRNKDKESEKGKGSSSASRTPQESKDIPCHDKDSILAEAAKSPEPEKFINDLFNGDYAVSLIQYGTSNRLVLQQEGKMPILMQVPPYKLKLPQIKDGSTILRGGWESGGLRVKFIEKATDKLRDPTPHIPIYFLTAAELEAAKASAPAPEPAKK